MSAFFLHDANLWFSAAIALVLLTFTVELLGMTVGTSVLGVFGDHDIDTVLTSEPDGSLSSLTSWLSLDKLPLMIWFIIFLTIFGLSGFFLNALYAILSSVYLSAFVSVPLTLIIALPLTARFGTRLARLLPKNESSALSDAEFVGVTARITAGKAQHNNPAEATFTDQHNQPHYVMVEPIDAQDIFVRGDPVILIEKSEGRWLVMRYQ